jgi:hypothetical protein
MAKTETTYATEVEQELTEVIDEIDIETLRAHFSDFMTASVEDDPSSQQMEVAA